jgi:hypothetical protein
MEIFVDLAIFRQYKVEKNQFFLMKQAKFCKNVSVSVFSMQFLSLPTLKSLPSSHFRGQNNYRILKEHMAILAIFRQCELKTSIICLLQ